MTLWRERSQDRNGVGGDDPGRGTTVAPEGRGASGGSHGADSSTSGRSGSNSYGSVG